MSTTMPGNNCCFQSVGDALSPKYEEKGKKMVPSAEQAKQGSFSAAFCPLFFLSCLSVFFLLLASNPPE